jgi:hypothetical protein
MDELMKMLLMNLNLLKPKMEQEQEQDVVDSNLPKKK